MSSRCFKTSDSLFHYPPQHGDHWGPWQFDARLLTLTHIDDSWYEIDLETLDTSARMLDLIFQITSKTWVSREDAGHLIEALRALLSLQANLCSFGYERGFSATRFLRARYAEQ